MVLKTLAVVAWNLPDYFPPNFRSGVLFGRGVYFFGSYQWVFYSHVLAGPFALLLGLVLMARTLRERWPGLHRRLGRIQAAVVLLAVVPSGFLMALRADTGVMAGAGFASLAVTTGLCIVMGVISIRQHRIANHERWMTRGFLLLFSAVVLRMHGGLALLFDWPHEISYPIAAWTSWLLPLLIYEIIVLNTASVSRRSFRIERDSNLKPAVVAASDNGTSRDRQ
jgi:uncharacterized membrane protein YozB (DUF420 family)